MAIHWINHHGFRYWVETKTREKWDVNVELFKDCLVVLFVVALTAVFIISFSTL
jgi:uncharacterized membrane protein